MTVDTLEQELRVAEERFDQKERQLRSHNLRCVVCQEGERCQRGTLLFGSWLMEMQRLQETSLRILDNLPWS